MISAHRLQQSLAYLAETDSEAAAKKALYYGLEAQLKTVYGQCFMKTKGKTSTDGKLLTVEERKSLAYMDEEYTEHLEKLEKAQLDFEILKNKRLTESLIVEVWRSEGANRRSGQI